MRYKIGFIILLILLQQSCCKSFIQKESLTLIKKPFTGNQLRINGYYYKNGRDSLVSVYFLYSNGVSLTFGWDITKNALFDLLQKKELSEKERNNKFFWGLFEVNDSAVKIEHLTTKDDFNILAYTKFGIILNDTTIHFTKFKHSSGNEFETIDDTFHFKQSPKPDSTNRFTP